VGPPLNALGEAAEDPDGALDGGIHRGAAAAQGARRRPLWVHRLDQQRASARAARLDERVGHQRLAAFEALVVLRVTAEVAGHQHGVDLARLEHRPCGAIVAVDVGFAPTGQVDRVRHRRGGGKPRAHAAAQRRGQGPQLEPRIAREGGRDDAVAAAVGDHRQPPAAQ
jgi:hypothetical protein